MSEAKIEASELSAVVRRRKETMEKRWQKHIDEINPASGDCTLIDDEVLLWAKNRINELQALVEMSAAHVFGSAGAAHMMDGFTPMRRPIDELVERIKAVLPNTKLSSGESEA